MAQRDEDRRFQDPTSQSEAAMPTVAIDSGPAVTLSFRGEGWDFFRLMLKNVLLTVVTLGIYAPWARTTRRQFIWRNLEVQGQPLDYTGTGKELFIGWLKVAAGYLVLFVFPQVVVARISRPAGLAFQVLGAAVIVALLPFAIYWARRFLLSRTRWRMIRFGLDGDAGAFAKQCMVGLLLTLITLGLYGPVFTNRVYGTLTRNTRYGNRSFAYSGTDGEAFRIAIKGLLLTVVTLGIYFFWYQAAMARFRISHTHFEGASGRIDVTGRLLFKLALINIFGILLTLGLAFPWTFTYTLREICGRLALVGPINFDLITPKETTGSPAGDSLASALGVELSI